MDGNFRTEVSRRGVEEYVCAGLVVEVVLWVLDVCIRKGIMPLERKN